MAFVPGFGFGPQGNPWLPPAPSVGGAQGINGVTQTRSVVNTGANAPTQTGGFQPNSTSGTTVNGTQQPAVNPSGTGGTGDTLYGTQNPYHVDPYTIKAPPTAPTQTMADDFLPPLFGDPYRNAINNATNLSNWYGASTPQAAAWQQQLYGDGMTNMEQTYAGSAAQLGARQLGQTHNRIANMFENSSSHGNLAPAMMDATNQHNMQMNQMIGQMGTQRQGMAANLLPFTAGFPLQASGMAMQGAQGMYDMAQNAMYGDLNFPMAMFGSNPVLLPSTIVT